MALKTIVLLSGGLDSVVNLKKAAEETEVLLALTFRYGQRSAEREAEASAEIAGLLQVPHKVVDLPWLAEITQTALVDVSKPVPSPDPSKMDELEEGRRHAASVWVPNRNAVFTAIGASFAESYGAQAVVAGFNAEEGRVFPDNSAEFISAMNRVLSLSTLNRCKVLSYTSSMGKDRIVRLGLESDAPLEKIWSCYHGGDEHCWACESCRRLERALRAAGAWEGFQSKRRAASRSCAEVEEASADIHEIFPSFQGEGPLVGSLQAFVRFAGCDRACRYCDTPDSRAFQGEKTRVDLGGGKRWQRPNPWSVEDLLGVLDDLGKLPLWLTGGEPLLQAPFLARLLGRLDARVPVGLETHGCAPEALRRVAHRLTWISADAKLPSVTGEPLDWEVFADFLGAAKSHGLYVKVVVSEDVEEEELRRLFGLVHTTDPGVMVFLQPVTPRAGAFPPSGDFLQGIVREARELLDVRVLPQVHRLAGWK